MIGPLIESSNPIPVRITSNKSCYDITKGLAINEDETLLIFYNRLIFHRMAPNSELKITYHLDGIDIKDTLTGQQSVISLCRTLRVPENGNAHDLPATFGPLPHIEISKCATEYIPDMKKKGGLMVPMLQREAMCIMFSKRPCPRIISKDRHFAVRVYAGGVNVLTGQRSTETSHQQDYFVSPLQNRVDGFGGGDGQHVHQFTAMPVGAGYSVEKQLSGSEIGGIQFHIAPRMKTFKCEQLRTGGQSSEMVDLTKTPRDLYLRAGQYIRLTEEPGLGTHNFGWTWESAETGDTHSLDDFHRCSESKRPTILSRFHRSPQYPASARPAFLSDLFCGTDLEPQGVLVVSAVGPFQITLRHRESVNGSKDCKVVFTKSICVSPFESAAIFEDKVRCVLSQYKAIEWDIENVEWRRYESSQKFGDYVPIHSIGIRDGYVIEAVPTIHVVYSRPAYSPTSGEPPPIEKWDMALASGANLRQIVKKDLIPEYWNWEAARFVNIQMLNTVAFESVTGLAAPATPISFQEYTKAGIPSLSYYPDAETSAVLGRFPVVRTIGNIDSMLGIKYAVRLDPHGKPVGCVICERSICDSVYSSFALETDSQANSMFPCLL
jgi:hypothetical protein